MRWIIKHENYHLTYKSKEEGGDLRWDTLYALISNIAKQGWEPWALNLNHAFNTAMDELTTFADVWYKRPDENN